MFKIATVCSGIGSPEKALKDLNVKHEIAFACEIDKYARQTYLANFEPNIMFEDMTKQTWERTDVFHKEDKLYSDLFIGGIPCQSFSLAGKRLGELDPRGLLFYDFYRYVKNQQPKVFIIENVKGLLSDNNGNTFNNWCQLLGRSMNTHLNMFNHDDSLLYNLHFKVLNSKDFGVPQHRERVFLVGVRSDLPNSFRFPAGERLTKCLRDFLDPIVDKKYYLSDKALEGITYLTPDGEGLIKVAQLAGLHESSGRVYSDKGLSPTITAKQGGGHEPYIQVIEEVIQLNTSKESNGKQPYQQNRVYHDAGLMTALDTDCGKKSVLTNKRIRRMTPNECLRLQGLDEIEKPCSESQTYKQAGNSITKHVIMAIIKRLLPILQSEETQAKVA